MPDSFPDLYKIPRSALTRIRQELPVQNVYLEAGSGISLFVYDNDTFIVYPYVTSAAQPATIRLHVLGAASALVMPERKDFRTGEDMRIEPLYSRGGETVFEVRSQPGRYDLYRIEK